MPRVLLILVAAVLSACPPPTGTKYPPADVFYFPTGIAHVDGPSGSEDGYLYVANADFDRRYDTGSIVAVDLAKIGTPSQRLPVFGAPVSDKGPVQITNLHLIDVGMDKSIVQIAPFSGEMAVLRLPQDAGVRLFIPTRSEDSKVYAIDAPTPTPGAPPLLKCVLAPDA